MNPQPQSSHIVQIAYQAKPSLIDQMDESSSSVKSQSSNQLISNYRGQLLLNKIGPYHHRFVVIHEAEPPN
jgi:hypothetical protein